MTALERGEKIPFEALLGGAVVEPFKCESTPDPW